MELLIGILWFIRTLKANLFWSYIFQLKEYRFDRLRDHLRTEKGKSLIFNPLLGLKLALFFALAYASFALGSKSAFTVFLISITAIVYLVESALASMKFRASALKVPIWTKKSMAVTALMVLVQIIFLLLLLSYPRFPLVLFVFFLVDFDVMLPVIGLTIISALKPINLILKKQLFKKAEIRRAELKDLLVIGITGSYGKTSTKEILASILETKFNVIKTKEHQNTEVAVAKLVLEELTDKHEIFVCEMGAYRTGEIEIISNIVKPKIGVFIGANEQHLSLFGSMENTLAGEGGGELLQSLEKGGLGIFNGENSHAAKLYETAHLTKKICRIIGDNKLAGESDVWAKDVKIKTDSVSFHVFTKKNRHGEEFKINLIGGHNIENILLAVAVAEELGMTLKEISAACHKLKPLPRTMSLTKGKWGLNIIDSTYSSNPTGVYSHIEYLKSWHGAQKFFIVPSLIELGDASAKIHHEIGRRLGETADTVIVVTKERFDDIKTGFYETAIKGKNHPRIIYSENPAEIIKAIKESGKEGDVVFLEGRISEEIIKGLKNKH